MNEYIQKRYFRASNELKLMQDRIIERVRNNLPSSISDEEIKKIIDDLELSVQGEILNINESFVRDLNDLSEDAAGTINEVRNLHHPWATIALFLRAIQRPIWVFSLLFIDLMVFSNIGSWRIDSDSPLSSTFLIINIIVLGFLFAERTLRNIIPLLKKYFEKDKSYQVPKYL